MPTRTADIYIAVGSNIAPERNVPEAVRRLAEAAEAIAVSTFYRTRPLERPEQADFRNGVVWLRVRMEREAVERDLLKTIESDLGRLRTTDKHAARTIDLDLALYASEGRAVWTDPEVYERNFIAVPLAQLAPAMLLSNGKTALQNAEELGENGLVADEALTQALKELVHHESRTR